MPDYTNMQLIEKIIVARTTLERAKLRHGDRCMLEMDPDYYGPCTCGRGEIIAAVESVIRGLKL